VTVNDGPIDADPTDLDGLRRALSASDPEGRLAPIGMRRIEIGSDTVHLLTEAVSDLVGDVRSERSGARVVLVTDSTPKRRDGEDLTELVERLLAGRFAVERTVIGEGHAELHADEEAIAEVEAAVTGTVCVVVVGSGTITDICKVVTARTEGTPLVVVQTAASVNGYSDDVSVVLKSGVKRTVPSRWPDVLLADLPTLVAAPAPMNAAGYGDAIAVYTGPVDWYLASLVGMDDSYHPAPVNMLLEGGEALLEGAAALRHHDPEALDRLVRMLALGGIAAGVTGTTACLSGTEHLVSHMLDMDAGQRGRPFAFHGAQVGVATIVVATAWEALLSDLDPAAVDLDACFPEPGSMEPVVHEAFAGLDPTRAIGEECWSDYRKKLERWRERRQSFEVFLEDWPRYQAELGKMVAPPERLGAALAEAGAPVRFGKLDPPASPETVRWALRNCHLMRNRFTLSDLLFFLGWWDDAFIERLLIRARSVGGGL
jgi:glycerol-1-phosphate dehydrogenase [NAD(P)+]